MSMEMKKWGYDTPKQILATPDHYVAIGFKHAKAVSGNTGLAVLENGKYIVKAGTIYPSNDSNAIGVVFNDYDVTDGDAMLAVIIHGFIQTSKLPEVPTSNAIAALKQIAFLPLGGTVTVSAETEKVDVETGETDAISNKATIRLEDGMTFRDSAETLSNWTIAGEGTTKISVSSVTLSGDKKSVVVAFGTPSSAAVAGNITMTPAASIVSAGKAFGAQTVLTVA